MSKKLLTVALSLIVIIAIASILTTRAASSGPNNGSTFTGNTGGGSTSWSNPSNAQTSNNVYATVTINFTVESRELKATGFGFSIPTDATVDGIVAEFERKVNTHADSLYMEDNEVKIVKGGTVTGNNKADAGTAWPTTDTYKTYGSATDKWGATWTPADINASDFGVIMRVDVFDEFALGSSRTGSVDHIRITVYYTEAGAAVPKQEEFDVQIIKSQTREWRT